MSHQNWTVQQKAQSLHAYWVDLVLEYDTLHQKVLSDIDKGKRRPLPSNSDIKRRDYQTLIAAETNDGLSTLAKFAALDLSNEEFGLLAGLHNAQDILRFLLRKDAFTPLGDERLFVQKDSTQFSDDPRIRKTLRCASFIEFSNGMGPIFPENKGISQSDTKEVVDAFNAVRQKHWDTTPYSKTSKLCFEAIHTRRKYKSHWSGHSLVGNIPILLGTVMSLTGSNVASLAALKFLSAPLILFGSAWIGTQLLIESHPKRALTGRKLRELFSSVYPTVEIEHLHQLSRMRSQSARSSVQNGLIRKSSMELEVLPDALMDSLILQHSAKNKTVQNTLTATQIELSSPEGQVQESSLSLKQDKKSLEHTSRMTHFGALVLREAEGILSKGLQMLKKAESTKNKVDPPLGKLASIYADIMGKDYWNDINDKERTKLIDSFGDFEKLACSVAADNASSGPSFTEANRLKKDFSQTSTVNLLFEHATSAEDKAVLTKILIDRSNSEVSPATQKQRQRI